jgi:PBP1b-binding outer membrane lipoprotein LpoB
MKKSRILLTFLSIIILAGCVQKSSKKVVILKLDVSGINNIETVGVRGNEKPLSWNYDLELKPIIKDTLYSTTFSLVTGYKFTELKFTVNGQFELNDKSNRRIIFSEKDTIVYEAKFDKDK